MRAHLNTLYALAISATATATTLFITACGDPPAATDGGGDSHPLCSDPGKADAPECAKPDGGTTVTVDGGAKPDAGTTPDAGPADPCAGFVVPLATRCSSDGTPPYGDPENWTLVATTDHCSLRGSGISFTMLPSMSGATRFTATSHAGQEITCVQ